MEEHIKAAFNPAFKAYASYVVYSLIPIVIGSDAALRYWIALQHVPTPKSLETDRKIGRRKRIILFGLVAAIIAGATIALQYYPAMLENINLDSECLSLLLLPLITVFVFIFLTVPTRALSFSAHRNIYGVPFSIPIKGNRVTKHIFLAMSLVISVAAIYSRFDAVTYVAFAAYCFVSARGGLAKNASLKRFIFSVSFLVIMMLFSFGLILASKDGSDLDDPMFASNRFFRFYFKWFVPAQVAVAPGVLLAMLLRFDYQNHVEANPEDESLIAELEVIPAPTSKCGRLRRRCGDGVVIPSTQKLRFPRPYYMTALVASFTSQSFATIAISMCHHFGEKFGLGEPWIFMLVLSPVGSLAILMSLFGRALVKGDVRKLLQYKEVWRTKPVNLTAVEEVEVLIDIKEEDEKKDAVTV